MPSFYMSAARRRAERRRNALPTDDFLWDVVHRLRRSGQLARASSPGRSPAQSRGGSSAGSPGRTPQRLERRSPPAQSSGRLSGRSPIRSQGRSPARQSVGSPRRSLRRSPERSPAPALSPPPQPPPPPPSPSHAHSQERSTEHRAHKSLMDRLWDRADALREIEEERKERKTDAHAAIERSRRRIVEGPTDEERWAAMETYLARYTVEEEERTGHKCSPSCEEHPFGGWDFGIPGSDGEREVNPLDLLD
ncbi:hypothetical protein AYO21_00447 [Fonsecaea monophora]|uniref:Uncharacterized protein n=1 Tax=Fonsecaea monophora TaxID=254056 RepID=A0A177FPQ4_9EURO|nr:hypothetical protein AYO21_00447 [Fonsecaea monophora]OAG45099.1 hypothetical protein AYO21_00447 [Fonsecaea monophora]